MRRFLFRLANVFRRDRADEEVTREIKAHLALLEDDYRRRGMTADEARLAARRALGSAAHAADLHRDARSFAWIDDAVRDVTHGFRALRRTPGFTAVAILTLALGIGANTAIFSVVSAVLLRPLPYRDADRLVQVFAPPPNMPGGAGIPRAARALAPQYFDALRAGTRTLSHVAGYIMTSATLTGYGDAARLAGVQMTASAFPMLGVPPMLGRPFDVSEESTGADAVVVLSHGTWRRYFNSDPAIVGRLAAFDGRSRTVVGVMPEGFAFPDGHVQYWIPYVPPDPKGGAFFSLATLARLNEGAVVRTAEDDINAVMLALGESARGRFEVAGLQDELVAAVKPALLMLAGAVGLVLLIACVNVASLLLARTAARDHEIAVRRAVGASPGRLIRQLLTESMLLSCIGGLAGTALAFGAVRLLRSLAATLPRRDLGPGVTMPRLDEIAIDMPVLAFTVVVAVLAGVVCGLLPALRHARSREADRLRERGGSHHVRGTLVVAEIAMAMVLLVGGGLLIRSFVKLATNDLGYDSSRVLTFQVGHPSDEGSAGTSLCRAARRAHRRAAGRHRGGLREQPAPGSAEFQPRRRRTTVRSREAAGAVSRPARRQPANDPGAWTADRRRPYVQRWRGRTGRGAHYPCVRAQRVLRRSSDRQADLQRPHIVGGRWHSRRCEPVLARSARRIRRCTSSTTCRRRRDLAGRTSPSAPAPIPSALVASVRGIVRQLDPTATVDNIATMEQIVSNAMVRPRLFAVLLGIFAGVADDPGGDRDLRRARLHRLASHAGDRDSHGARCAAAASRRAGAASDGGPHDSAAWLPASAARRC